MGARTVVLLVDPHESSRTAYALILRHGGYTVLEADSVAETLSILRRREVNAIITELVLPQIDGCELVRRIKRDPATVHLPVLVMTADLSVESREQAEQAKCTAFLLKPCGPKEFLQELRDMVRGGNTSVLGHGREPRSSSNPEIRSGKHSFRVDGEPLDAPEFPTVTPSALCGSLICFSHPQHA